MQVSAVGSRKREFGRMDVRGFVPQDWIRTGGIDVRSNSIGMNFGLYSIVGDFRNNPILKMMSNRPIEGVNLEARVSFKGRPCLFFRGPGGRRTTLWEG
jgi:hypothetical protein